ncbi:hypothetical protein [Parapedobacter koreensis]|nr:hypothetical protein [Parapedobacter koreensis]
MNDTWRAINTVSQPSTSGNATAVKALQNKTVNLAGYMIPIESGLSHKRFMLSLLPIMQCMFCGQNGIPPMVEVVMKDDAVPFSDFPVEILGRLYVNVKADGGMEIQLLDAELYQ